MQCDIFLSNHCFFISFSLVSILAMSLLSGRIFPLSFLRVPLDASTRSFVSSDRSCPSLSFRSVSLNSLIVFIFSLVITLAPLPLLHMSPQISQVLLPVLLIHFLYVVWLDLLGFLQ